MPSPQPEVLADIMMWSAFDKTRDEIATRVNAAHGTEYSARDVGEVINSVEQRAEQENPWIVLSEIVFAGYAVRAGVVAARNTARLMSSESSSSS